jgi:hypothetical protein
VNKKGQTVFTVVFWIIIFFLVMAAGLGTFITIMVGMSIDLGGLTGLEAFLVGNLLLFILLAFILAVMWWSR